MQLVPSLFKSLCLKKKNTRTGFGIDQLRNSITHCFSEYLPREFSTQEKEDHYKLLGYKEEKDQAEEKNIKRLLKKDFPVLNTRDTHNKFNNNE